MKFSLKINHEPFYRLAIIRYNSSTYRTNFSSFDFITSKYSALTSSLTLALIY